MPPYLGSFVARHVRGHWAVDDKQGEGDVMVEMVANLARRASLLLMPIIAEAHWTLLVLEGIFESEAKPQRPH